MDGEGVGIVGEPPTPLAPLLLREHEHEISQRRGGGRRRPARWIGGGEGSREGGVEWSCVKERVSKGCGGRCGGWTRKRGDQCLFPCRVRSSGLSRQFFVLRTILVITS